MQKKENLSRRSVLKGAGAGLGLALAAEVGMAKGVAARTKNPKWGKFHHIGIPTQTEHEKEYYIEGGKVHITNPDFSPGRIEWCRWLEGSPDPEKLRTTVHIAYQVEDCAEAIKGHKVFLEPFVPFDGVRVAFIEHEGFLIEFLEKTKKESPWPPKPAPAA